MTLLRPDPGFIRVCTATVTGTEGYLTWTRAAPGPYPTDRLLTSLPAATGPPRGRVCAPRVNSSQRPRAQSVTVDRHPAGRIRRGAAYALAIAAALIAIGVLLIGMAQP